MGAFFQEIVQNMAQNDPTMVYFCLLLSFTLGILVGQNGARRNR